MFISPMRGVLHSGHIISQENGLLILKGLKYNADKMPANFGGMSGGGVWRTYFIEGSGDTKIVETVLCGLSSWQIDQWQIACQGWDRIDQALIPEIRDKLRI
jgi:hypothetical protein